MVFVPDSWILRTAADRAFPGKVLCNAEIHVPNPNDPAVDPVAFGDAPATPQNTLPVLFV